MKKKLPLLLAFAMGIAFTAIISWKSNDDKKVITKFYNQPNPETSPIIAIRKIKLKDEVSAAVFEKFATKVGNDEFGKLPGVKFYYGKGERGDEPGSYLLFMEFDSKTTRDFYAPAEDDDTKRSEEAKKMVGAYFAKYDTEYNKLAEVIVPAGKKGYVDYIIFE